MSQKSRLKKILSIISPDETSVDFKVFDEQIATLKDQLKEKITVKTLEDVNVQLDKFKKRIDFDPLLQSAEEIKQSFTQRFDQIGILLKEKVLELNTLIASKSSVQSVENAELEISSLRTQLVTIEETKKREIEGLSQRLSEIGKIGLRIDLLGKSLEQTIQNSATTLEKKDLENENELKKQIKLFQDQLEAVRRDLLTRIGNLGGGSMNRQIRVEGVDALTKYTDINIYGVTSSVITSVDNTNKRVNIGIQGGGGGSGTPTAPDTSVQFNDGGSFGGSQLNYDKTGNPDATFTTPAGSGAADGSNFSLTLGNGGVTSGDGGSLSLTAGNGQVDSDGGEVSVTGGMGDGATNRGGGIQIQAGGTDTNNAGASIYISAGDNDDNKGGDFVVQAGDPSSTGEGGSIEFTAADGGSSSGPAGSISFTAGSGQGGNSNGGNVTLIAGAKNGAGIDGTLTLSTVNQGKYIRVSNTNGLHFNSGSDVDAILDTSLLSSTDKTFTFPNQSGTFALVGSSGISRVTSIVSVSSVIGAVANTDYVVFANVGIQLALPSAVGNNNLYTVKNYANSSVLVTTTEGIDDSPNALLTNKYQALNFISNGSVWGVT